MAFPRQAFPVPSRLKRGIAYAPESIGLPASSTFVGSCRVYQALRPAAVPFNARHVPRAPLPFRSSTPSDVVFIPTSEDVPLPSSLLRAHAPDQNPPIAFSLSLGQWVFAGCYPPLLEVGPSRRYLCESFSTCLDPYPGCSCGAFTRFFPQNYGLPSCLTRSALSLIHTMATSVWLNFRGCSHSLMFKPVDLLATQVAPTAANIFLAEQPWLLHPNTSRFVTSPCPGYANRPIRATDGKRTCTSQDSQPCRPIQSSIFFKCSVLLITGRKIPPPVKKITLKNLHLSRKLCRRSKPPPFDWLSIGLSLIKYQ